jgi:hypothetical protein
MSDMSPAARDVLKAFAMASDGEYVNGEWVQDDIGQLVASLRVLANQAGPDQRLRRSEILMIAAELESETAT